MTIEAGSSQISEHLRPLYEARTAGKSIQEAVKLLERVSDLKQIEIIEDPAFGAIVRNALEGSEEHRQEREKRLFAPVRRKSYQALDKVIHSLSNS